MIELNLTMVVQLAIVLTLMVILSQAVFKPFLGMLQERKNRVEGAEKRARELQQKTDELIERYREMMDAAQAKGASIQEEIRKESLAREMEILRKAMEEANRLIREMKDRINDETETARAGLKLQARNLSREIAEKILGRNIS